MQLVLTSELLIEAYKHGLFPMAYSGHSEYVHWVCPENRGQLPIETFHIPRSLKKQIRSKSYRIKVDQRFREVMEYCAEETDNRPETWINNQIIEAFTKLHRQGHAHSVEYYEDDVLLGGVYGLKIGAAFFGESMFSRTPNASKIALCHLVARLWKGGFTVLDTQFINDHLLQFGAYELSHHDYIQKLHGAIDTRADFHLSGMDERAIITEFLEK